MRLKYVIILKQTIIAINFTKAKINVLLEKYFLDLSQFLNFVAWWLIILNVPNWSNPPCVIFSS